MAIETERIRSEPHVEIGSIILRDTPELVERWCVRAREEQPTAARLHRDVLRNRLSGFLGSMGQALLQAGEGDPQDHRESAMEHGEQRWETGWSLTELVRDYQILQVVVLEHLAQTLERPLGYREAMAVGVFIDDAIAASIAAYVVNRDDYLREMERTGVEALRDVQTRKDAFLALVVHELRNPVAPIMNATETLAILLQPADPPVAEAVRLIRRQSRQLARILDDLSDLTRIAQGRLELRHAVVDVADVVHQAVQTCEPLLTERRHRLTTRVADEPLSVQGDADRLVQVVVNLLNNAAKYTPPGGDVSIQASRRDDRVELSVRDNGIGIPADMIHRVFDMYTRAADARETSPDGLGIGLALVKELVVLHKGTIECLSGGPGQGAEFIVSLPASRRNEE
ncbi:MAG TPA: HAMP domain-containing sensor histidine kinase [Gemmatimonadaceae bacterium]|nr:HAMP domain-containing sensor histidine kinase [Gemmatimonadaceae bacterium]